MWLFKQAIGGEIVDRDGDHKALDSRTVLVLVQFQDIVCQDGFLAILTRPEKPACSGEVLGNFGDDFRGTENRKLRAQRGKQVPSVTLSPMIGMHGDLMDEGT